MRQKPGIIIWVVSILLFTFTVGCKKKVPVAATPPPPTPPAVEPAKPNAPTIGEFVAQPGRIEAGRAAELRWQVRDATQIEIDHGIGAVSASGHRPIGPAETTTYTLSAKGPGGETNATATLSVTLPPPPPPVPEQPATAPPKPTLTERLTNEVVDAFFDFDRSDLREDARASLAKDASALKMILDDFPAAKVIIEGHCDERGSAEYNLALGDRRASSALDFLTQLGVPADRLIRISYGKERPQCTEATEECYQKNRRAHLSVAQ